MTTHTGFAWHVHHDVLVEWCSDYAGRVAYIKIDKPLPEQATRLRLFQMVKGQLPAKYVAAGAKLVAAGAKLAAARAKCVAARAKYVAAGAKYVAARAKYVAAMAKYVAARAKYVAAMAKYEPKILALHAQECPDCPWNGKTIFPKEGAA